MGTFQLPTNPENAMNPTTPYAKLRNQITTPWQKAGSLAFALTAVCSSITQAAAEGGGAHNGPNTSGVSISLQMDRSIRLEKLNKTILSCQRAMLEDLAEQMVPDPSAKIEILSQESIHWKASVQAGDFLSSPLDFQSYSDIKRSSPGHSAVISMGIKQEPSSMFLRTPTSTAQIKLQLSAGTKFSRVIEFEDFTLPSVLFDNTFNNGIVDEKGGADYSQIAVGNLRIFYLNLLPDETHDVITLKNSNYVSDVPVTVNVRNYQNCLVNGVQQ